MIIAGLTGSIAMGKSETARLFAAHGIPVFDSDAEVHSIYGKGGAAVPVIERAFPTAVAAGMVDRAELSRIVTAAPKALAKLESLVHPLVEKARAEFIDDSRKNNEKLIILDIPLLFEMGLDRNVDRVIVVTAPPEVQRQRAMAREGMTSDKLEAILSRQLPDAEKRARADFVVDSSLGFNEAAAQVNQIVKQLKRQAR